MRKSPSKHWNWSIKVWCQADCLRRDLWELQVTNMQEKTGTSAQTTEGGQGSGASPTGVPDVVGESIRHRYAGSPGLIDLGVSRRLMNRLLGFGRQRVPLLNRV